MTLEILSLLFLLLSGGMAAAVLVLLFLYLTGRARTISIAVFIAWLLYTGIIGYTGIAAKKLPPGPLLLVFPVVVFVAAFLVRHPGVRKFAARIPVERLIGMQTFRILVELGLFGLYQHQLVPRLMTFEGGNLDIVVGLSAPLIAYLAAARRISQKAVRIWSIIGILLLLNIVARALLTFSGVLKTNIPNVGIGLFPFTFLPGFLAPLALCLHVLLLRSLPRKNDNGI